MLELAKGADLLGLLEALKTLEHTFDVHGLGEDDSPDPQLLKNTVEGIALLVPSANQLGITWLGGRAQRLREKRRADALSMEIARYELRETREAIQEELSRRSLFTIADENVGYFDGNLLTAEAAAKFSASDQELDEAGKCFALGRYTAAVLHAMRALEEPLNRMRRVVALKAKEQSWGPALDQIESTLRKSNKPKTKQARERRRLLIQATVEFRGFKDAWRNHAMHTRQNYSREQAEHILSHVRSFIDQLAPLVAVRSR